jgi:acyl carrier protein
MGVMEPAAPPLTTESVFTDVSYMIRTVLDGYDLGTEITMATTFFGDLEMESIDLVGLSALLVQRYGDRASLAQKAADADLDEIAELTVGQMVGYIVDAYNDTADK